MLKRVALVLALCGAPALGQDLLDDLVFYDVNLGNEVDMGPITPEAVQGYEILYATPGAGDISEIAGHLLLRVKLNNNPRAAALGVENPNDLVISFLADTEAGKPPRRPSPPVVTLECERNNWFNLVENNREGEHPLASIWQSLRGLAGGFFITMDRQTLGHALKSYTIEQDRNLLRYELVLTPDQQRGLLARLYEARTGPKPRYFFFSQNCGSVLVRIVAEGIGDEGGATFSPLVSPPHTLLGNLVRSGSATRITPAFHSYRKEGFIARELFNEQFRTIQGDYPGLPWPSLRDLNHRRDSVRAPATACLADVVYAAPELGPDIYQLAALAQEKEMVFADKALVCENYTTDTTAQARTVQAEILEQAVVDVRELHADTDRLLNDSFGPREAEYGALGTAHTELYRAAVGWGFVKTEGQESASMVAVEAALLGQDLGSRSRVAMQRSSALGLGAVSALVDHDGLADWRVTGLRLRKFRDTLNNVPSGFTSTRGLGLGLKVLDVNHFDSPDETVTTLGGVEALFNLGSTPNYNDFLLLSMGGGLVYEDAYAAAVQVGYEHLWSWDSAMNWQWRNSAEYDLVSRDRWFAHSSLAIRLGELWKSDFILRLGADYRHEQNDADTLVLRALLEINRW